MASIVRTCNGISSTGKAWVTALQEPGLRAAPLHELVIPIRSVPRLDDLTLREEEECWHYALERARHALHEPGVTAVGFLMNDGLSAGQTVGCVHIHVIGFGRELAGMDVGGQLNRLSSKFLHGAIPHAVSEINIGLGGDYAQAMRRFRHHYQHEGEAAGFSIFTNKPFQSSDMATSNTALTIQCWDKAAPRVYGLTNLMRVVNGYRDRPYDWPVANLDRGFEPSRNPH